MYDPLFEPITINKMEIKNRIYLPAMHLGMGVDFQVTDQIVDFYAERARGGAGMICVGYATIDELSGNTQNIGAHKDEFIPGLKRLSDAIKDNGSRSVVPVDLHGISPDNLTLEAGRQCNRRSGLTDPRRPAEHNNFGFILSHPLVCISPETPL